MPELNGVGESSLKPMILQSTVFPTVHKPTNMLTHLVAQIPLFFRTILTGWGLAREDEKAGYIDYGSEVLASIIQENSWQEMEASVCVCRM